MTKANFRNADHPVAALFLERWSPRAFTNDPIAEADLKTIFEAARWAPSASNAQPWRFAYARRDAPRFAAFLGLLVESNQTWAKAAAVLGVLVSKRALILPGRSEPSVLRTHSLDAGAAWGYLALQASLLGYAAHGMAGFDYARAAAELDVPEDCDVEMAFALGRPGDRSLLPEALAGREHPSGRAPQSDFVFEGGFRLA